MASLEAAVAYPALYATSTLALLAARDSCNRAKRSVPWLARRATRASICVARSVAFTAMGATPVMMVDNEPTDDDMDANPAVMLSDSAVDSWCARSAAMDDVCADFTAAREASNAAVDVCSSDSFANVCSSAEGVAACRSSRRREAAALPAMLPIAMAPWHFSHTHISPAVALHPPPATALAPMVPHWHTAMHRSESYPAGGVVTHAPL